MAKQKDIFRTLKSYSHGFHTHATEEENKAAILPPTNAPRSKNSKQRYSPM